MNQEIYDWQLSNFLHKEIDKLPMNQQAQLKSLRYCGRKIVRPTYGPDGVYVLSKPDESKLFGLTMCKNPFACPCCSAHRMSIYSAQIAIALDEMRKRGYFGFMMTLTIPHLNFMSCREITDCLYETYSYFRRTMKQKNYRKTKRTGTASHQFYEDVQIAHSVTVCEYTHGENGWHPHFHAILWIPKSNVDKVLKWQTELNKFWLYTAERIMKKHFSKCEGTITNLFKYSEPDAGVIFSTNSDGSLSESLSSQYICGWGANREVTGNYRKMATHNGHRTPYQILEDAYNGDTDSLDLYLDYCLAVTRKPVHHRVIWSRTGIKAIVIQAQQIQRAEEYIKKKDDAEWKVLCWFDRLQWACINEYNAPTIANILWLAAHSPKLLYDFLDGLNLKYHMPDENYFTQHIENIYNKSA